MGRMHPAGNKKEIQQSKAKKKTGKRKKTAGT